MCGHADDTTQDSEETATAFTVSQSREQSFSLQIHESIEAVSFRRIATIEQLQLEYTHKYTHTHTQSASPQSKMKAYKSEL